MNLNRTFVKIKLLSLMAFLSIFLGGCEDVDNKNVYNFVGDSIIYQWPLNVTFPSQIVYNYGRSGVGVNYLERYNNSFNNQNVVVMIGTNDYYLFYRDNISDYVESYLEIINNLTDLKIYLISVLPREYKGDPEDINIKIEEFNSLVKSRLQEYPKIEYIDVYNDFLYKDHINYQYYVDGLHLTIYGYDLLSSKILEKIK